MSPDPRHRRLREVFLRARDLPEEEREAFLRDACADDAELRRRVDELLAHDARPISFVEAAAAGDGARLVRSLVTEPDLDARGIPPAIGGYRILGLLGEGGMGTVYEAQQEDPPRRVALKVIRPGLVSTDRLRRFQREARVLARLRHPGIAQIYAAGAAPAEQGGLPFFAMELVRGSDLIAYADAQRLDVRARLELVARVCSALQHAHERGVVHRDLKPANILVEEPEGTGTGTAADRTGSRVAASFTGLGRPKILDFGVARTVGADIDMLTLRTGAGQLVGTLPYMSPEQASGDSGAADARADVYSVGVIAFELLCGRLPYDVRGKALPEAARIIRDEEPSSLGSLDRTLRGEVEVIVAKALAKEPERRYASAAELGQDIRRHLHDLPVLARPASAAYHLVKFARRHRAVAAGIAIAFVALLAATVVSLGQLRIAQRQRVLAADRADALASSAWHGYVSLVTSARAALDLGDPRSARDFLADTAPEHRGWEHAYLRARLDPCIARLSLDEPVATAALIGPEALPVTVSASGWIRRWDPLFTRPAQSVRLDAELTGPAALSADAGRLVGVVGPERDEVVVWDGSTGERVAALEPQAIDRLLGEDRRPSQRELRACAISSDGRRVALGGRGAVLWEPHGVGVSALPRLRCTAFAFDPNGLSLAVGAKLADDFRGYVMLLDPATGTRRSRFWLFKGDVCAIDLGPGEAPVLLGAEDGRVYLHDGKKPGELLHVDGGHQDRVDAVAVGPGGRFVASGSRDGSVRVWAPAAPADVTTFVDVGGPVDALVFGPEGERLLCVAGREARLFDLADDRSTTVLRSHGLYVYGVAFSPDGSLLVSGAWDGDLRFWDARSGEPLAARHVGQPVLGLALSSGAPPLLVTCHDSGTVRVLDADTGRLLRTLRESRGKGPVRDVGLTADGSRLVVRARGGVEVWDPRSGELLHELPTRRETGVGAVAVSADGRLVAGSERRDVVLWDARTGAELRRLEGHRGQVSRLAFDSTGERLASGSQDGTVRVRDARTGAELLVLAGHVGTVHALAFAPSGDRLASGADDRRIRLWDLERGDEVLMLAGHEEYVYALAFSPDGTQLVSGSGDHTVRVWDTAPARERWRARARRGPAREAARTLVDRHLRDEPDPGRARERLMTEPELDPLGREMALQVLLQVAMEPE